MWLRCASFNVLADAWLDFGDYAHTDPYLLSLKARIPYLVSLISSLQADVVALQEVELALVEALDATGEWKWYWAPNEGGAPDGCLTLVRQGKGIASGDFSTCVFSDGSNHIVQLVVIGGVVFANTHIQYHNPVNGPPHIGMVQTEELLGWLGPEEQPAVILVDSNDRPGGSVRALIEMAGFTNVCGDTPTALIVPERAAIDLIAVRGVRAERIETMLSVEGIPNAVCPSDHIPVMAYVEVG